MKISLTIAVLLLTTWVYGACPAKILSVGTFSLKAGNQTYVADTTHARGYANRTTNIGYITAANTQDLIVDIEVKNMNKPGTYTLTNKIGKAMFSLDNKSYALRHSEDYLRITITQVRTQGSFFLLSGRFEGRVTDKLGNAVRITEGVFETKNL